MSCNVILGSGLIALIARKVLGDKWKIIPIGPTRFYKNTPVFGDNFINYDLKVLEIFEDWGLKNTSPIFYKRPFSYGGELHYNSLFCQNHAEKIGYEPNPQIEDYLKTTFSIFPFSCHQLHQFLVKQFKSEIESFFETNKNAKNISSIKDKKIILNNGKIIEYDNMISTIPYNALAGMLGVPHPKCYYGVYYYIIRDDDLNLDDADQVLSCDYDLPFYKCTKINKGIYLFETLDYNEDIYNILTPILGLKFEILKASYISDAHIVKTSIDNKIIEDNKITNVGSYAQCDPLMDIGSCIKRINNLVTNNKIK